MLALRRSPRKLDTGDYWGVMALTLNPNGYAWDFESALAGPTGLANGPTVPAPTASGYSDKGFGTCHNAPGNKYGHGNNY